MQLFFLLSFTVVAVIILISAKESVKIDNEYADITNFEARSELMKLCDEAGGIPYTVLVDGEERVGCDEDMDVELLN